MTSLHPSSSPRAPIHLTSHPMYDHSSENDMLFTSEQSFIKTPIRQMNASQIIISPPEAIKSSSPARQTPTQATPTRNTSTQATPTRNISNTLISPSRTHLTVSAKTPSPTKTPPRRRRKRWDPQPYDPSSLLGSGPLSPSYEHIIPSPTTSFHSPPSPLQSPLMKYDSHWEETWDDGEDDGEEPFQAMGDIENIIDADELDFDQSHTTPQQPPHISPHISQYVSANQSRSSNQYTPKQQTFNDASLLTTPAPSNAPPTRSSPHTTSTSSSPLSFSDLTYDPHRVPTPKHVVWDESVTSLKSPTEYFATRSQPLGSLDGQASTPPQFGIAPRTPGVNPTATPISILKTPGSATSTSTSTPTTAASRTSTVSSARTPLAPIQARAVSIRPMPSFTSPSPIRASKSHITTPSKQHIISSPSNTLLGEADVSLDVIEYDNATTYEDPSQTPIRASPARVRPASASATPTSHRSHPSLASPTRLSSSTPTQSTNRSHHTPTSTHRSTSSHAPSHTRTTIVELQARIQSWMNDSRIKLKEPVIPSGAQLIKEHDISVLASSRLYQLHRFIHFTIDPTRIPPLPQHESITLTQHIHIIIQAAIDQYMIQAYTTTNAPRVHRLCQSRTNPHLFTLLLIFDDTSRSDPDTSHSRPTLGLATFQPSPIPTASYIPSAKWHADWIRYMSFYCQHSQFIELRPPL